MNHWRPGLDIVRGGGSPPAHFDPFLPFFVIFDPNHTYLHVQCIPLINLMGAMIFLGMIFFVNWDHCWPLQKKNCRLCLRKPQEMHWGNFVILISSSQAQPPHHHQNNCLTSTSSAAVHITGEQFWSRGKNDKRPAVTCEIH